MHLTDSRRFTPSRRSASTSPHLGETSRLLSLPSLTVRVQRAHRARLLLLRLEVLVSSSHTIDGISVRTDSPRSCLPPLSAAAAAAAPATPSAPAGGPRTLSGAPAEPLPSDWPSSNNNASSSSSARRPGAGFSASGGRGGGGIRTFRDLAGGDDRPGGSDDDEDDEDRGPENLFTGGERSGLNVQNPDVRKGRNQPDAVKEILRQAAQNAQGRGRGFPGDGDDGEGAIAPSAAAGSSSFGGAGRTIGDDGPAPEPAAAAASGGAAGQGAGAGAADDDDGDFDPVAIRHLNFWQDGFSIEDGPLQRYDDPQSRALLQAIENQSAPPAAFNIKFGQRVELRVAKRLNEKYSPPAPGPMKAFEGQGNRLGSPAPGMASSSSSSSATAPASAAPTTPSNFSIDDSKPVTSVQIRLADGTRLVGRFNHDHTVADIRNYINASQPGMAARSYALQTSFPPKPVENESKTIKEAGLVNAVVLQKWT